MASITALLSFFFVACTTLAQMMPLNPGCTPSDPSVKTLTYTQWMAPQIAPTSTVYDMIVTHYDYVGSLPPLSLSLCSQCNQVVYCSNGAATVTNVPPSSAATSVSARHNPTRLAQTDIQQQGPFTTQVRSSALTVEAVQCIRSDMVLTRREIRGYDIVKRSVNERAVEASATTSSELPKPTHPQRNPHLAGIHFPVPKGWKQHHAIHQAEAAHQMKAKRQVVPTDLSPQAASLVSQLQTAQYALELCNDDFNLTEICDDLRDPAAVVPLANVGVSASQAGDIVCWASVFGIDLNTTNAALLGDLAAAIYGLELGDNFTTTANTTKLCNNINLDVAPYLGIDSGAVNDFICGGPSSSVTVTAVTTQTVVVVPGSPTVTFTASGAGFNSGNPTTTLTAPGIGASSGEPWQSGLGTGAPHGWPNGTYPYHTGGSAVSGGAIPTSAGNPWGNSTGSDSLGIDFPQPSNLSQGDNQKTPVALDTPPYYPASTMETVTATYGSYD